jgi:hypothetical protein
MPSRRSAALEAAGPDRGPHREDAGHIIDKATNPMQEGTISEIWIALAAISAIGITVAAVMFGGA